MFARGIGQVVVEVVDQLLDPYRVDGRTPSVIDETAHVGVRRPVHVDGERRQRIGLDAEESVLHDVGVGLGVEVGVVAAREGRTVHQPDPRGICESQRHGFVHDGAPGQPVALAALSGGAGQFLGNFPLVGRLLRFGGVAGRGVELSVHHVGRVGVRHGLRVRAARQHSEYEAARDHEHCGAGHRVLLL